MLKKILALLILASSFLFLSSSAYAIERPLFISFVNPIRGDEGWIYEQGMLDLPRFQYKLASENGFPVSWLLRYDAATNATVSAFFKELTATDSSQTVGAFLEITPKFTAAAGVTYSDGEYLSAANRIFLSGYSQPDRIRLIDTYMAAFYQTFGYYPKTVGAWHLDSYSLAYLEKKYSVIAAVVCDEQYSTDNYRLWGSYLGSPYFPNKLNSLTPATTRENRVNIALTKWAIRDPFNFYGRRAESNFSVQVNDYSFFKLTTNFFENLLGVYAQDGFNEFTQINIGLENDYSLASYKNEIENSYAALKRNQGRFELRFISLLDFGQWLRARYTFTNPAYFFQTKDITGGRPGTVYWYQNPFYRFGLKSEGGKTWILDFRVYNQKEAEPYYLTKNISRILYAETNPIIDSVKYLGSEVPLSFNLEEADISFDSWQVIFREGDKVLSLEPERIVFDGSPALALETSEVRVIKDNAKTIWEIKPKLPFTSTVTAIILGVVLIVSLVFLLLKSQKNRLLLISGWLVAAITLVTVIRSGLLYPYGLGLWGPNGHDAIFHLSLSTNFSNNLRSLMHPQIAGEKLANYHFGFDLALALVNRVSTIPQLDLYFRLAPIVIVLLLVYFLFLLLKSWRYSNREIALAFGLTFLSGSAGFLFRIFASGNPFSGESVFWANQSVSLLLNPPFALSLVFLVAFLYFLEKRPHRLSPLELVLISLLGGSLALIKVYAFLLLAAALLIKKKFRLFLTVSFAGFLFLLPTLKLSGGSPFVFNPLWFTRTMFESFDRLYFPRLATAWQVYENNGRFAKLLAVNFFAVAVFYVGNLWLRLLGLPKLLEKNVSISQGLVKVIILLGLTIPLVFTQKVNPWNTIQFMYYSLFFLSLLAAKQVGEWLNQLSWLTFAIIAFIFVVLASVTSIGTLSEYITAQSASRISLVELRALEKLRRESSGVVVSPLTYPRVITPFPDPRPLYVYVSTAYISALTGKIEYLSDTINLDITGFDYQQRQKNVLRLYQTHDPIWVNQFLKENRIRYVYETPLDQIKVRPEDVCLTKIFDSGEVNIYKYTCL